jgi:hypothetical protein
LQFLADPDSNILEAIKLHTATFLTLDRTGKIISNLVQ